MSEAGKLSASGRQTIPVRTVIQGHAGVHTSITDLQRLVAALDPGTVVPMHTEGADRYGEFFGHVVPQSDGNWLSVGTCLEGDVHSTSF